MENDYTKLTHEQKMIRSLVDAVASQSRKEYIRLLLREVENESDSD